MWCPAAWHDSAVPEVAEAVDTIHHLTLTKDGHRRAWPPTKEDTLFGQGRESYEQYPDAIFAASDGSVQPEYGMGSAVVFADPTLLCQRRSLLGLSLIHI